MRANPIEIYVVDDDPGYTRLIKKNLRRGGFGNVIRTFSNGEDVLRAMHDEVDHVQSVLMLLDLNMPGISGQHVLRKIRSDERTRHVPVIVLTTTDSEAAMKECYALGCNMFMTKPMRIEKFTESVRQLGLVFQIVETAPTP